VATGLALGKEQVFKSCEYLREINDIVGQGYLAPKYGVAPNCHPLSFPFSEMRD